jgi:hypothetical protein
MMKKKKSDADVPHRIGWVAARTRDWPGSNEESEGRAALATVKVAHLYAKESEATAFAVGGTDNTWIRRTALDLALHDMLLCPEQLYTCV